MYSFYELEFLSVNSKKSGDAITIRYEYNGETYIHIVDGGYQSTGQSVVDHVNTHYGEPEFIDHVVATHPDRDHCGGLRTVLEELNVGCLWMHRPWLYADELIDNFTHFRNPDRLAKRLRECYPNLAALEEIALNRGIRIEEPFAGAQIGAFRVLSPTKEDLFEYILESEKTPESNSYKEESRGIFDIIDDAITEFVNLVFGAWGDENFSDEETSPENEMSVVQAAIMCGHSIVLTGDAGRRAMWRAYGNAELANLSLPGVDKFQVPHHGSRRNLDSDLLNAWIGDKHLFQPDLDDCTECAYISASAEDEKLPKKTVIRALIHRGMRVHHTEGKGYLRTHGGTSPQRDGLTPAVPYDYPEEQEDD